MKRKKELNDYYETAAKLEDAQGFIVKLTAQVNRNYENSSMPSSKCIDRKKITNNREKTGKKPGAQAGHPHHPRKAMEPDEIVEIPVEEKLKGASRYTPTGNIISKQAIGITVVPVVIEYRAMNACGNNNNVVVCSNDTATMYFARENKGHAGILIHDHEAYFYSYGFDHQECMAHIERHLRESIENEKNLTWNGQMLTLIQKMIHENNMAPEEGIADEKISEFEARYDAIVQTATKEYEDDPPSEKL